MAAVYEDINFDLVLKDLGECCLSEEHCGGCQKQGCLVGYAKESITKCFKDGTVYVENGRDNIPVTDLKIYNNECFEAGIAHILKQCKSCKEEHFDNCIVSVLRSCYEAGLLGEVQEYHGSSFQYLSDLQVNYPTEAAYIMEEYKNNDE